MIQNPTNFFFSNKADCCNEHYDWSYDDCMGSSSAANSSGGSGDKWYADWTSGEYTCKNDGGAPDYSEWAVVSVSFISFTAYLSQALSLFIQ